MNGTFIEAARDTLIASIASLPLNCFIQIIGFGSNFSAVFDNFVEFNDSSKIQAM